MRETVGGGDVVESHLDVGHGLAVVLRASHRALVLVQERDRADEREVLHVIAARARDAYDANPSPIPYESTRYRSWADLDGDGVLSGESELLPLFERAARDYLQPLFFYGSPRVIRLGAEFRKERITIPQPG